MNSTQRAAQQSCGHDCRIQSVGLPASSAGGAAAGAGAATAAGAGVDFKDLGLQIYGYCQVDAR